jgi:hypothetical protein
LEEVAAVVAVAFTGEEASSEFMLSSLTSFLRNMERAEDLLRLWLPELDVRKVSVRMAQQWRREASCSKIVIESKQSRGSEEFDCHCADDAL